MIIGARYYSCACKSRGRMAHPTQTIRVICQSELWVPHPWPPLPSAVGWLRGSPVKSHPDVRQALTVRGAENASRASGDIWVSPGRGMPCLRHSCSECIMTQHCRAGLTYAGSTALWLPRAEPMPGLRHSRGQWHAYPALPCWANLSRAYGPLGRALRLRSGQALRPCRECIPGSLSNLESTSGPP